jgi:uncharacterized delta-60 repeat protein
MSFSTFPRRFHLKHARRTSVAFALVACALFIMTYKAMSAPGDLDLAFDGDGKVTTDFGSASEMGEALALQPDGKIVVVGGGGSPDSNFLVARYHTNGGLDNTFDGDGKVVTDFFGLNDAALAVAIQTDGKIVVGGFARSNATATDFALARYQNNGMLDTSFGTMGKVTTDFFVNEDEAHAIIIQPDGKIIAVGYAANTTGDFALARYQTNGILDNGFGVGGKLTTDFSGRFDFAHSAALQSDGKIVAAGYTFVGESAVDFGLVRYDATGMVDTNFGTMGKVTTDFFGFRDEAHDVALQSDGKIVAAGYTVNNANETVTTFGLARYHTNGSLDLGFDGDGKVTTNFTNNDRAKGVVIKANGRIVAAGHSASDFTLARYNTNGSLDNTFGTGGKVITDFGFSDTANDVVLQHGEKIVVAGSTSLTFPPPAQDFAIARYDGSKMPVTLSKPADFDGDGKGDVSVFRPSSGTWYVLLSSNGAVTGQQFGVSTDQPVPADYDGDARTDIGVYRNGTWYYLHSSDNTFHAVSFGTTGDVPVAGDYDGDSKHDVAVFRPTTGTWFAQRSTAGFFGIQFGTNGDVPARGDFDGDRKCDIAVFRPSTGAWYIQQSSTNTLRAVLFGTSGDAPLPRDYDGDGKSDIAVFRPSQAAWYILQSLNGSVRAVLFGNSTDVPVPVDYDGDGKADVAVFRNGEWYILDSSGGGRVSSPGSIASFRNFGLAGDKPGSAYVPEH